MIVTIFGATGQVGVQVINQALAKGHTVRAFGRNIENLIDKDLHDDRFVAIKGYVFDADEVFDAIKGSDAVISCLGGSFDGTDKTRSLGMKNIVSQMQKLGVKRIVAIGGVGILDDIDGKMIMDSDDYPEQFKPVSLEHLAAYQLLDKSGLDYTFVCPFMILDKPFEEGYTITAGHLPEDIKKQVNAGNIAHCMIECVEKGLYIKERISISN